MFSYFINETYNDIPFNNNIWLLCVKVSLSDIDINLNTNTCPKSTALFNTINNKNIYIHLYNLCVSFYD